VNSRKALFRSDLAPTSMPTPKHIPPTTKRPSISEDRTFPYPIQYPNHVAWIIRATNSAVAASRAPASSVILNFAHASPLWGGFRWYRFLAFSVPLCVPIFTREAPGSRRLTLEYAAPYIRPL
jgi:hypothetical protein